MGPETLKISDLGALWKCYILLVAPLIIIRQPWLCVFAKYLAVDWYFVFLFCSYIWSVLCICKDLPADLLLGWAASLPSLCFFVTRCLLSFYLTFCWSLFAFVFYSISAPTSSPSFSSLILFTRGPHSIILSPYISVCPSFSLHQSEMEGGRERENQREGGRGKDGQIRWQW